MNWQIIPEKTLTPAQLQQLSPASWAYIGDAVYELYVRQAYLLPPKRLQLYHQSVVAQVRAETQAHQLQMLEPLLTQNEQDVIRRGRNATNRFPKRLDPQIYQQATSLETLVGYLYLTDPERLSELIAYLNLGSDDQR